MKVGIYTLGCKVNTYESEFIISLSKTEVTKSGILTKNVIFTL